MALTKIPHLDQEHILVAETVRRKTHELSGLRFIIRVGWSRYSEESRDERTEPQRYPLGPLVVQLSLGPTIPQ